MAETILIVMPSWIGDAVMATPVLRSLRHARPDARIALLVRPGIDAILAGLSWFDAMRAHPMKGWIGAFAAGGVARAEQPEMVLLLPNSFRSALIARRSGARRRVGYATDGRRLLLSDPVAPPARSQPVPAVDWYASLLERALGIAVENRRPELFTTAGERSRAAALLEQAGERYAVLVPGANRADKRWPVKGFAALAAHLRERHGLRVVLIGSPAERPLLDELERMCGSGTLNAAAWKLDLGAIKAVIASATVVVSNDTGPRHVAAALGAPTVALFGPTDHRWTTLPVEHQRLVIAEPFLPDTLTADRHAMVCRIDRISPGDVCFAVDALLARADGGGRAAPDVPPR